MLNGAKYVNLICILNANTLIITCTVACFKIKLTVINMNKLFICKDIDPFQMLICHLIEIMQTTYNFFENYNLKN